MKQFLNFFRTRQGRYFFLGILVITLGWFFLRGCGPGALLIHPRYNIAVDRSWYPLALYGKENNMLAFTDELLEAISAESGIRFNLLEIRTPNLIRGLEGGLYQAMVSAMPPTHLNMLRYRFSDPIFLMGLVLLVPEKSTISSLDELNGHFVGIRRGVSLNLDVPFPAASIVPFDNMTLALADLEDGKIDALIMDSLQAYVQIQGFYTGKIKVVTSPLTQDGIRLVALNNPHYNELFETFNKSLLALKQNGKYDEILTHWGLFNPTIKETTVQKTNPAVEESNLNIN